MLAPEAELKLPSQIPLQAWRMKEVAQSAVAKASEQLNRSRKVLSGLYWLLFSNCSRVVV